jgi:DNA-binding MarR family transcriptional regulator
VADRRDDVPAKSRREREARLALDLRVFTAQSEQLLQVFARKHDVTRTELNALRHIAVADSTGEVLSAGDLRTRLGMSPSAMTYLVDRMIEAGHIQRETDPDDRRRVIVRHTRHGREVAQRFFRPLGSETHAALAGLLDEELDAAHRVLSAMTEAIKTYHDKLVSHHRS